MPQEPLRRQRIHHSRQPRLAWNEVHWAHADRRVLRRAADGRLAGHIGLFARNGTWHGAPIRLTGGGGVTSRADFRRQGFASAAMRHAAAMCLHNSRRGA